MDNKEGCIKEFREEEISKSSHLISSKEKADSKSEEVSFLRQDFYLCFACFLSTGRKKNMSKSSKFQEWLIIQTSEEILRFQIFPASCLCQQSNSTVRAVRQWMGNFQPRPPPPRWRSLPLVVANQSTLWHLPKDHRMIAQTIESIQKSQAKRNIKQLRIRVHFNLLNGGLLSHLTNICEIWNHGEVQERSGTFSLFHFASYHFPWHCFMSARTYDTTARKCLQYWTNKNQLFFVKLNDWKPWWKNCEKIFER